MELRRKLRRRLIAGVTTALCAAAMLAVAPPGQAAAASQADPPNALVTLGDSFISGEGGRWQGNSNNPLLSRDGTDRAYTGFGTYDPHLVYGASYDNGCNRSDSAEGRSSGVLQFQINLACSGATTANVIDTPFKGEPPQSDQLLAVAQKYRVGLITLSIGGNDLGFSAIISDCVKAYTLGRPPCNKEQQAVVAKKLVPTQQQIARTIAKIQSVMDEAGYKTTDYRIILQSAPSPIPRAAEIRYPEGTWERWHTGGCPFWNADADWARDALVGQISAAWGQVAAATKVDFLDLRNTLQTREVCSVYSSLVTSSGPPSPTKSEWARFLVSGVVQGEQQESFHPSYYGQLALGRCLALMADKPALHGAACLNTPGTGPQDVYLNVL